MRSEGYQYYHRQTHNESENLQLIDSSRGFSYNIQNRDRLGSTMVQDSMRELSNMDNNIDPVYKTERQQAIIARQPKLSEPAEKRIIDLVNVGLLSTEKARSQMQLQKTLLHDYFVASNEALNNGQEKEIFHRTQELLKEMAKQWNTKIVAGEENLQKIPDGQPFFIVTNHLGAYKPLGFKPEELGGDYSKMPIEILYPFPAFFAALMPIAEKKGDTLHQTAYEYPHPVGEVQTAAGSLIFAPNEGLEVLEVNTKKVVDAYPNSALVIFPEGGTSGKKSGGGIYDLERFKSGAFVIAGSLHFPIVPAVQYYNPDSGFEISILKPIVDLKTFEEQADGKPSLEGLNYYSTVAKDTQAQMQQELHRLIGKPS